jgi:TolB protein
MFNQSRDGLFPTWLLWIIGPVTVLAAALIIFAVVLGIRAGQRQIEIQQRQEVGIALQRAIDFQAEGRLQDAVAEYRRVLVLDPGNETALAGIQSIVDQATGAEAPALATAAAGGTPAAVAAPAGSTPAAGAVMAPTATATASVAAQNLFDQARTVYTSGQWQQAVDLLLQLQQQAPDFQTTQVEDMLYNSYVNLAAAADQADDLESAVGYVDQALALRPNSGALQAARTIAANYLDGREAEAGAEWATAVEMYTAVYDQDPGYRDVAERLQAARIEYGDKLALEKEWCKAEEQYTLAIELAVTPGSIARRDDLTTRCAQLQALRNQGPTTPTPAATRPVGPTATPEGATPSADALAALPTATSIFGDAAISDTVESVAVVETPTPEPAAAPASGPLGGRIVYSAVDPNTGQNTILLQPVQGGAPGVVFIGGVQPAYRPDQTRLVFRDLRGEFRGLTAFDPASGLELRFTTFAEDAGPVWNNLGNVIAFASNREGDRRWRIYIVWADVNNEATGVTYGQYPAWSPVEDRLAFQGCDDTGNNCGLRTLNGAGADGRGLTSVPADMQPAWAPNGAFVAFTSEGRDGNPEVYRVDVATNQVTRLTESGGVDAAPAVSPDGSWVAFLSNRSGVWSVWAVPSSGGEAQPLFDVEGGINAWQEFTLQWLN